MVKDECPQVTIQKQQAEIERLNAELNSAEAKIMDMMEDCPDAADAERLKYLLFLNRVAPGKLHGDGMILRPYMSDDEARAAIDAAREGE